MSPQTKAHPDLTDQSHWGVKDPARLSSVSELLRVLVTIAFTASAHHAAVNFGQVRQASGRDSASQGLLHCRCATPASPHAARCVYSVCPQYDFTSYPLNAPSLIRQPMPAKPSDKAWQVCAAWACLDYQQPADSL